MNIWLQSSTLNQIWYIVADWRFCRITVTGTISSDYSKQVLMISFCLRFSHWQPLPETATAGVASTGGWGSWQILQDWEKAQQVDLHQQGLHQASEQSGSLWFDIQPLKDAKKKTSKKPWWSTRQLQLIENQFGIWRCPTETSRALVDPAYGAKKPYLWHWKQAHEKWQQEFWTSPNVRYLAQQKALCLLDAYRVE